MTSDRSIPGYTLLHLLGRGDTSLVYLARNSQDREVALKVPHERTLAGREAAERFGNEVRLTLQVRHPQIVRGFAGTPFGPQAFLAVQYFPEGSLCDVLKRLAPCSLPLDAALRVLADVASALTYLHGLGAVHQDVKRQNVYVQEGRAALGDLGSAYFTAQGGRASGSPYYMAPEVYRGESAGGASDVYSFGVLAYELLGGRRPFAGDSYEELMAAHLNRFAPPLLSLRPELPPAVARLGELALAKRPADRPTAADIHRALLAALGENLAEEDTAALGTADSTPVRQVGRHVPTPLVTAKPTGPETGDAGRWNPFRRRK
ncbi:serine/threonine protein kinase [Deinococcus aetherius]|uniref:Serine/threonine protein kinase n=1 Tax=Deinococcus aetherius TaxID=200252 RepID=A0ABM8A9H7_9DEIO|nr:serine/threonine-protein kinase [Deinococcus aetherius]BDP40308.1 serine/threonine protein kinase [Deinococcus aetherius]